MAKTSRNAVLRSMAAGAALMALSAIACAQVTNGGFDQGGGSLSGWTRFNNTQSNVIAAPITPRSGTHVAKLFGGANGNPNYSGVFQNVPAVAGQVWQADAHLRHNTGDSLAGTSNRLALKIEFYRVPNGSYGTADMLGENQIDVLTATSAVNVWLPGSLIAVAPTGTVEARIALVFVQAGGAGGAALIDDVSAAPAGPPPIGEWQLIWSDEFDAAAIDGSKWRVEDLHLIKNNELQYYAPDEVYLQNGNLVLRSRERTYWGFDSNGVWRQFNYTSGLVESKDRFATAFGKIEVRARCPSTRGIWPAHWMLPDSRQWPPEIDIMELLGHEPTRVYMTHHWGQWPNVQSHGGNYNGPNFSQGFHTFGVEWTPERLDWRIDGVLRFTSLQSIPVEPFYVILNTAVGGDWPGNPDGTTIFPQLHEIDYVRVYVPADPGAPEVELIDTLPASATADGVRNAGEYESMTQGIHAGLLDQIGRDSEMYLDSSGDGRLHIAFDSFTAWSQSGAYGAVIYVDSESGGFASTYEFSNVSTRAQRMASGKGNAAQRADLYFAPGFLADYAIVVEPALVSIFDLDRAAHTLINGAALDAATDILGGSAARYRLGGSAGRLREIELRLAHLAITPGSAMRFVTTLVNADTAFRANEFVGVAPATVSSTVNPAANPVVLHPGDFVRFTTVPAGGGCSGDCNVAGGDADVDGDCDVDLGDLTVLLSGYGQTSGAAHSSGDVDFDGDIELDDLTKLLSVFGAICP